MRRSMNQTWFFRFCCVALTFVVCTFAWAQTKGGKSFKRAQPPKFDKPNNNFFADAFKEGLQGDRPGNLGQGGPAVTAVATNNKGPSSPSAPAAPAGGLAGSGWAGVISGPTLESIV